MSSAVETSLANLPPDEQDLVQESVKTSDAERIATITDVAVGPNEYYTAVQNLRRACERFRLYRVARLSRHCFVREQCDRFG